MARNRPANQETAFLADICERPDDDAPRLVFADWLEENGQPQRAEFIRVQIELAKLDRDDPRRLDLQARETELTIGHAREWETGLPGWARSKGHYDYRRGLIGWLNLTQTEFLRRGEAVFRIAPVQTVRLRSVRLGIPELAASPLLGRLSGLDLRSNNLIGEDVEALVTSPHLGALTYLGLLQNNIGDGLPALAAWPGLARIASLDLTLNYLTEPSLLPLLASHHLGGLRWLGLEQNPLGPAAGRALARASALAGLSRLELRGCDIDAKGAGDLGASTRLVGLSELDLSYNPLREEGGKALAGAPLLGQLTSLELGQCQLGDAGLRALAGSPYLGKLRRLGLRWNSIGPEGAAALAAARVSDLRELYLEENPVGAEGARALASSPSLAGLIALELWSAHIGAEGAIALAESPSLTCLKYLKAPANDIGPKGAAALAASPILAGLSELNLSWNKIGTEGARALAASPHLANLRKLDLSFNDLDDQAVLALAASPYLAELRVLYVGGGRDRMKPETARALAESPNLPNLISISQGYAFETELPALLRAAGKGIAR
jgi:uncharacterized protein (TIGR02996 family)